jgi:hypothetical protein
MAFRLKKRPKISKISNIRATAYQPSYLGFCLPSPGVSVGSEHLERRELCRSKLRSWSCHHSGGSVPVQLCTALIKPSRRWESSLGFSFWCQ